MYYFSRSPRKDPRRGAGLLKCGGTKGPLGTHPACQAQSASLEAAPSFLENHARHFPLLLFFLQTWAPPRQVPSVIGSSSKDMSP
jgi:hypothetical protein